METDIKFGLERAIDMASLGHFGQRDKIGHPYILHVLRVMFKGKTYQEMIVGVLHDVVEDSRFTLSEVESRFGKEISEAVDCITHRPNEPNDDYIRRVKNNPLSKQVKRYDLEDNMRYERTKELPLSDRERLFKKYIRALTLLEEPPNSEIISTGTARAAQLVRERMEGIK